MSSAAPLQGVRVVDASAYMAGPFAGVMLHDLGATVIKVERPPKGDPLRTVGHSFRGESAQCASINRGKRSVLLDLEVPRDRSRFLQLVVGADILIRNTRPGGTARARISDSELDAVNPTLVRLSVSGYGSSGPLASSPAFDALIQARTGLAVRQGRDGDPATVVTYVADKVTSLFAVQAVLAALVERTRTGSGQVIELSMLHAMAYFNFPDVMEDLTFLAEATTPNSVPRSQIVATEDGYLAISPASGAHLRAAFDVIGHPEWLAEMRDATGAADLMDRLLSRLESITLTAPTSEWLERFSAADVPVAPVMTREEHLSDPHVVETGTYGLIENQRLGTMRVVHHPAVFGHVHDAPAGGGHFPTAGEHTDEVFPDDGDAARWPVPRTEGGGPHGA